MLEKMTDLELAETLQAQYQQFMVAQGNLLAIQKEIERRKEIENKKESKKAE